MGTPAHDIAAYLTTVFPQLTVGTLLRVGDDIAPPVTGRSALGVWVANTLGLPEVAYVDGGRRSATQYPGVQISVRGDQADPATAEMIATLVMDHLDKTTAAGAFIDVRVQGSGVLPLGRDGNGFPRFSINLICARSARYLPTFYGPVAAAPTTEGQLRALSSVSATRRNGVFTVTATVPAPRLCVAMPSAYGTPSFFNGLADRTAITLTPAGSVGVLEDGRTVPYSSFVSSPVSAGTYVLKAL